MKSLASVFLIGILFWLGITVSGMINPAKVLNSSTSPENWTEPRLRHGRRLVAALIGWVRGRRLKAPVFGGLLQQSGGVIDRRLVAARCVSSAFHRHKGFCPGGADTGSSDSPAPEHWWNRGDDRSIVLARTLESRLPRPPLHQVCRSRRRVG